jgi:trk system potassium uptake protein TrkA
MTTSLLTDLKAPRILAEAISRQNASILRRVGARRVVLPYLRYTNASCTRSPAGS